MFGRYEKHDNSINKHAFYELAQTPNGSVMVTWGRIGSKGQSQLVSRSEASDRIRKKQNDGYDFISRQVLSGSSIAAGSVVQPKNSLADDQAQARADRTIAAIEKSQAAKIAEKKAEFDMNDWLTK